MGHGSVHPVTVSAGQPTTLSNSFFFAGIPRPPHSFLKSQDFQGSGHPGSLTIFQCGVLT